MGVYVHVEKKDDKIINLVLDAIEKEDSSIRWWWSELKEYEAMFTELHALVADGNTVYYALYEKEIPKVIAKIKNVYTLEEYKVECELKNIEFNPPSSTKAYIGIVATHEYIKAYNFLNDHIKLRNNNSFKDDEDFTAEFSVLSYEEEIGRRKLPVVRMNDLYNETDLLNESFISEANLNRITSLLENKKNIIMQGPPGVGKTFLAKRLAYQLMGYRDLTRVQMIQFHQSYSYEDFIQGYKPTNEGKFSLKNGVFYEFCLRATNDPNYSYYFIIDEINRGNLSKIFGELMMLIEGDKRGEEYAIPLTYSNESESFYVPENLYIIGLMNTADRSLAVVDYALRRRFAFVTLEPVLDEKFIEYLVSNGLKRTFANKVANQITNLNEIIKNDTSLGNGFMIGHSYFCSKLGSNDQKEWYQQIIENEICPLLEEYWFDDPEKAASEIATLLELV